VRADGLVVAVSVSDDYSHTERHRSDLAIDEAADGFAAPTATPVDRGRIFGITKRGERLDIKALQ
jgi:hypothetical protein